ncbi:hypothetical protein COJ96_06860 [Bacillus sp. AFS073361]|uniref:hypothetical protein n=1 Tax=Bacillus sp. AFS073361 TaxID=2033511 RepID=UPI000BF859A1|nr:hypothetical protein [Bacillus sp. AFS073361]PFP30133.1 hypothetical protein COJ96_06860 [Bacillus sp. AFS073361]
MNELLRARRLFRLQCFINDVTALFNEMADGKNPRGRLKRIKGYKLSFATTKKEDPELVPLVETCERLRIELTDGKPYDQRKSDEIDRLFAEFEREVKQFEL